MKRSFRPIYSLFLAFALVTFALITVWWQPVAASSLTDSRIRQLEFQVRSLQTQISQISTGRPSTANNPLPMGTSAVPDDPTLTQQFDNLAILAIELKQRVDALEENVAQLRQ